MWVGTPEAVLTGPSDEQWDLAFIAAYPSVDAFANMVRDPTYQQHVVHRQAAVRDSRLIRMWGRTPGASFGHSTDAAATQGPAAVPLPAKL